VVYIDGERLAYFGGEWTGYIGGERLDSRRFFNIEDRDLGFEVAHWLTHLNILDHHAEQPNQRHRLGGIQDRATDARGVHLQAVDL